MKFKFQVTQCRHEISEKSFLQCNAAVFVIYVLSDKLIRVNTTVKNYHVKIEGSVIFTCTDVKTFSFVILGFVSGAPVVSTSAV